MVLLALVVLAYILLYAFASQVEPRTPFWRTLQQPLDLPSQSTPSSSKDDLETWLRLEEVVSLYNLEANIAPKGRNAQGAAPGTVLASPSREHPNYYFQWIRDAAITMSTIIDIYADTLAPSLSTMVGTYSLLQYDLQHSKNPSGTFSDLSGLGEPKFNADASPFWENWGRPQCDGPALRALALTTYLRAYNASHPKAWTSPTNNHFALLYKASLPPKSLIKADLEYVSHYWTHHGFDLWEEEKGIHFYTAMVQYRALREGVDLATLFEDAGAASWYKKQAEQLSKMISEFWDPSRKHLVSTLKTARTGLDCALLLGSLHGNPGVNISSTALFPPHSDEILLSLLSFTKDQARRFPINSVHGNSGSPFKGTGLGRYPEDVYDGYGTTPNGGNPWFLCTASAAEILYRTASQVLVNQSLLVTSLGIPFWSALLSPTQILADLQPNKSYNASDEIFSVAIDRLKEVGDEFLAVMKRHAGGNGSLSEQFDRVTGFERGARDLTWSYGAFLHAYWARKKLLDVWS